MPAIEGNRASAHIAPAQCVTPAQAAAAAAAVRERRRSLFFVAQPPRITEAAQPIKADEADLVPPSSSTPSVPIGATFLYVPDMNYDSVKAEGTLADLEWIYKIEDIRRAMCAVSGLTKAEMIGPRRTKNVAEPRQLTMLLCKVLTARSLPEIGRRMGGKDHTTVLHSVRKYQWMIPILQALPHNLPVMAYATTVWKLYQNGPGTA